ncbi:hypothetical protein ACFX2J_035764 [Malus domestica]
MDRQIGAWNGSVAISQIIVGSRGAPPLYLQMISEALPLVAQPLAGGVSLVDKDEFAESLSSGKRREERTTKGRLRGFSAAYQLNPSSSPATLAAGLGL